MDIRKRRRAHRWKLLGERLGKILTELTPLGWIALGMFLGIVMKAR